MKSLPIKPIFNLFLGLGLMSLTAFAAADALPKTPQAQSETAQSVQPQVDSAVTAHAAEKRHEIIADAVVAVQETQKALQFLEEKKTKEALQALERATGKLELILAREPQLALAPVNTEVVAYDLLANPETIRAIIADAKRYLESGEVQKARALIANLASEVVFRTTSIPLGTYPEAIKAVTPLIDAGKIQEAKVALQSALNLLVVTEDDVIPLPVVRAQHLLAKAEALAENEHRTEQESQLLEAALAEARKQIEIAELLGYGNKEAFQPLYEQLDQIEAKTAGGKGGKGWFDQIKKKLSELL